MSERSRRFTERVVVVGHGKAGGALLASLRRARVVVKQVSGRKPPKRPLDATLVLLCVPDRFVREQHLDVVDGCVVAHVAGALPLTAVDAVRRGAFHPLASLDGKSPVPRGCLCAFDADDDDTAARLSTLAKRIGLVPQRVVDEDRAAYHAGAVIAGNLATALLQLGVEQLQRAGVAEDIARVSLARLLSSTAARAEQQTLAQALTGPVARHDEVTLRAHRLALRGFDDADAAYRLLSQVLAARVVDADAETRARLLSALR